MSEAMEISNPTRLILLLLFWFTSISAEESIIVGSLVKSPEVHGSNVKEGSSDAATTKPPCPSYITCPYPSYPRPTTKPPGLLENKPDITPSELPLQDNAAESFVSTSEKTEVQYLVPDLNANKTESSTSLSEPNTNDVDRRNTPGNGNAQGPSVSATQKPPCPSHINCPYPPYPRPTTSKPSQEANPATSSGSTTEKTIVEYFGPDPNEKTPEVVPATSGPNTNDPDRGNKPGNAQGPSIPATQKPPCPSYINCPYPSYPRPTTSKPSQEVNPATSSDSTTEKTIVEYFGPDPNEKNPEVLPATNEPDINDPDRGNKPGNGQGPSIPATQKPPCPSYIDCPYPSYPRPTTKKPIQGNNVAAVSEKTIPEFSGVNAEKLTANADVNSEMGISNGESQVETIQESSLLASSETSSLLLVSYPNPSFPTFSQNPSQEKITLLIHPVNTEENSGSESDFLTERLQIVNGSSFPSLESQSSEISQSQPSKNSENANLNDKDIVNDDKQSDSFEDSSPEYTNEHTVQQTETNKKMTPTPGDWHFPGPSNAQTKSNVAEISEYLKDTALLSRGPTISATQKPKCAFYATCPYEYPEPTTAVPPIANRIGVASGPTTGNNNKISDSGAITTNNKPFLHSKPHNVALNSNGGAGNPSQLSSQDAEILGNQGVFLPFYTYVYGLDPYVQHAYYYNGRPSVLLKPTAIWPSFVRNPWIYRRPSGSEYIFDQESDIDSDEVSDLSSEEESE